MYQVGPCFEKQGGSPVIDANTYLYYMQMTQHVSVPSSNRWVPYDDKVEQVMLADFKRLWATNFLDDLAVETHDYKFSNGVIGKVVLYQMEERQRVKIVDYVGSKQIETSKIDEELKKQNMRIALDSFIDQGLIRRVAGVVRNLYAEKGYEYAEVKPEVKPVNASTKTVNLTFHITEGPKVKIRAVDFLGNSAIGDSKLSSKMKENKGPNKWAPFILRGGTFKEAKFEEDADLVVQYYRERGYVRAQVGQPQLKVLEDAKDGRTRFVELQIPVTEGPRYKIGEVNFSGNTVVKTEGLRPLFKMGEGDWFNEKQIRKGFEKLREVYGSIGYFEFTGNPGLFVPGQPERQSQRERRGGSAAAGVCARRCRSGGEGQRRELRGRRHDAARRGQAVLRQPPHLPRQHDDARQRHPARGPAARRQRVQHRGAEIQRPPPQSAWLLQAARRRSDRRPEDAERRRRRSTSG